MFKSKKPHTSYHHLTKKVENVHFNNHPNSISFWKRRFKGEIMKMGYTFACFMRKKNYIFTSYSTFDIQKYFFYLEFHFAVKKNLWRILLSFQWLFFNFFLLRFDMSNWQLFNSMFLKHKMNDNELFPPKQCIYYQTFIFIKKNVLQQSIETLFYYDYNFESNIWIL